MRTPRKILDEYIFNLEGMSESIKARIMVDISAKPHPIGAYSWDISHFFKDCDARHRASTLEEAQENLRLYTLSLMADKVFAKNLCY
ncbi:MAG: hypothetical protein P1U47_03960 [Zhongshania sp.]|uniref:hypothetical protein n=1 Tax=Zhongshania sp. TaxID=1971902 RepID=UPI00260C0A07|nr:hypothetical protein [Zhongshania sp.]MDF1691504.1 hypothetical protein [Zhongshania sp.]